MPNKPAWEKSANFKFYYMYFVKAAANDIFGNLD